MSSHLTFYYCPGACSIASHILLHLASLAHTPIRCSVKAGLPDDLKQINPKARVPTLLIKDSSASTHDVITESVAVMTAIAQMKPDMKLLGTSDADRVRIYEWCNYLSGTLHTMGYGMYFRPERYAGDNAEFQAIVKQRGTDVIESCYKYIESRLDTAQSQRQGSRWAVGDTLTIVDPFLYVFWRWGVGGDMIVKGQYPLYEELVRRLHELDSVKRVLEIEDQNDRIL